MGFLTKKKIEKSSVNRKRKVKKQESPPNITIKMKHVEEELPPNEDKKILTWEPIYGYDLGRSFVVLQHIQEDRKISTENIRIKYWAELE